MIRNESVWTLAVHFISVLSFISTGTALTRPSAATSFDGEKFAVAEPASSRSSSANHTATHGGAASSSSSSAAPTTLLTLNLGDSPFRADLTSATLEVAASRSHPRRTPFLSGSGKDEQKESIISVHGYPGGTMPFHLPPTHSIQSSTFPLESFRQPSSDAQPFHFLAHPHQKYLPDYLDQGPESFLHARSRDPKDFVSAVDRQLSSDKKLADGINSKYLYHIDNCK